MNNTTLFSRRSVCISGGGLLALGLTGCGPVVPAIVEKLASILISKYTGSALAGDLGGFVVGLVAQQAGLYDIQDSDAIEAQQLSASGKSKYDTFKQVPASYRLVYDAFIPEFSATVTNNSDNLINVGEVNCVMYSELGSVIERIASDEYVNLEPGQSTTLSQSFKFSNLPESSIGYLMLETKYSENDRPLSNPLLALMAMSTLTAA
jgi:hypothetical protein